jgi:hypothetical protein
MDLTRMLKDNSLANLDWLESATTFKPGDKDTDQKDDLAIEWGRGDAMGAVDRPRTTISDQTKVQNTVLDTETLLDYVQVLLHQGVSKGEAMKQAVLRFPAETINAAAEELKGVMKLAGVAGSVLIDLRRTRKPAAMIKAAMRSPFRKHVSYVLMRPDQVEASSLVKARKTACGAGHDGSIDGYFSAPAAVEQTTRWFYEPLNLPVITSRHELDDEYYDHTMVDLVSTSGLTETEAKEIYRDDGDAWSKLRRAFRLAAAKRSQVLSPSQLAPDRSADHKLSAEMTVAVDGPLAEYLDDSEVMVTGPMEDVVVDETSSPDVDAYSNVPELDAEVDEAALAPEQLDICEVAAPEIEVDAPELQPDLDVDPETAVDEEFVGSDEVEVEDKPLPSKDLEVSADGGVDAYLAQE